MKTILGYDPGGNGAHGVAALSVDDLYTPTEMVVETKRTVDAAIGWFSQFVDVAGIGIDTLTQWATGQSGWRPADLWLRNHYPSVVLSVAAPNSLRGSMVIGGIVVKSWFHSRNPKALISETHPKVLYFALSKQEYDWKHSSRKMLGFLSEQLGISVEARDEHQFDSAMSCYAVFQYLRGHWKRNLHADPASTCESSVEPFGESIYAWP